MKLQKVSPCRPSLPIFLLLLLALFSGSCSLIAQDSERHQVTATQYCDFLNHATVSDADFLYDEAMSTDPEAASILRTGTPGSYHYEVIAGRENFPITYVNTYAQSAFCNEQGFSDDDENFNEDAFLKSNRIDFYAAISTAENQELNETKSVLKISSYSGYLLPLILAEAVVTGVVFGKCLGSDPEEMPSNSHSLNGALHNPLLDDDHQGGSSSNVVDEDSREGDPVPSIHVPNMLDSSSGILQENQDASRSSLHASSENIAPEYEGHKSSSSLKREELADDLFKGVEGLNFEEVAKQHDNFEVATKVTKVCKLPGIVEGDENAASPLIPPSDTSSFVDPSLVNIKMNLSKALESASNGYATLENRQVVSEVLHPNDGQQGHKSEGSVKSKESKGSKSSRSSTRVKRKSDGLTRAEREALTTNLGEKK